MLNVDDFTKYRSIHNSSVEGLRKEKRTLLVTYYIMHIVVNPQLLCSKSTNNIAAQLHQANLGDISSIN